MSGYTDSPFEKVNQVQSILVLVLIHPFSFLSIPLQLCSVNEMRALKLNQRDFKQPLPEASGKARCEKDNQNWKDTSLEGLNCECCVERMIEAVGRDEHPAWQTIRQSDNQTMKMCEGRTRLHLIVSNNGLVAKGGETARMSRVMLSSD